jgi:PAS domain S-box-containing protein
MATQLQHGGEHFVRFYHEDQLLAADVASYLSTALECGSAIIIATEQRIAAVRRHLDVLAPHAADALIALDAAATLERFLVNGWPDRTLFQAVVGSLVRAEAGRCTTVRAYGEMVALLCAQGRYDAAIELEKLWNELAHTCTFSLFCAYGWNLFPTAELADSFRQICHQHGHACSDLQPLAPGAQPGALKLLDLERKAMALDAEVARRKDAEQLAALREVDLADFLDNAAEGIHRVGSDGVILWANKAELHMLGYHWEEYVGRHIADFHVDQEVIRSILERLRKGETIYDQPALLRCKDGTVKHVLVHSNACFMDGELRYTRCFTRDASERHALEQVNAEREALLKELMIANRNKDQFLAMLGHELRNPLSPIQMALDLMEQRGDANCAGERNIIRRQVSHLVRLVDDLLDVARVMQDKIELQQQNIALDAVVAHAAELARADIDRHRHHLMLQVGPGLAVNADKVRLAQVLANLLINAARYTADGGSISLTATGDGATIHISVKDNGRGMSGPELERVFDLFYQGHRSLDRPEGGLGIGLSLVRRLVELHGGTVAATSAGPGRGSEFVVRLPAAPAPEPAPAPPEPWGAPEPLNILLVDDNTDVADTLGELLAARGHNVQICNTPAHALSVVDSFRPEVAILDIGLPGMNGYELAAQLKVALGRRSCRLIAQSGYGQPADILRSISAGFERHLVKPVTVTHLLALIEGREIGARH